MGLILDIRPCTELGWEGLHWIGLGGWWCSLLRGLTLATEVEAGRLLLRSPESQVRPTVQTGTDFWLFLYTDNYANMLKLQIEILMQIKRNIPMALLTFTHWPMGLIPAPRWFRPQIRLRVNDHLAFLITSYFQDIMYGRIPPPSPNPHTPQKKKEIMLCGWEVLEFIGGFLVLLIF